MNRLLRAIPLAAACLAFSGVPGAVMGRSAPPLPAGAYTPATTTVAVLPVINMSNEKDTTQRAFQASKGSAELRRVFESRGFNVVDDASVTRALADAKIDLSDDDQQKKSTLYTIGHALNADLVAFAVIENVNQHTQFGVLRTNKVGTALVKLWLVDVKSETPILNGVSKESKSDAGFFESHWNGASAHIISAVANSIRDQLKNFFKPYPEAKEAHSQK